MKGKFPARARQVPRHSVEGGRAVTLAIRAVVGRGYQRPANRTATAWAVSVAVANFCGTSRHGFDVDRRQNNRKRTLFQYVKRMLDVETFVVARMERDQAEEQVIVCWIGG